MLLSLGVLPLTAQAGVFSFVGNILSRTYTYDSTNMIALSSNGLTSLQPTLNPNPDAAIGGADIQIDDSSTLVPSGGPSVSKDAANYHPANGHISTYVVRPGDTLSQIAQMYDVTTNTIIWANNLKGGIISVGQTLVILPVSGIQHTVQKGETVASIAKKYGGETQDILSYNNLVSANNLKAGDSIIIPDGEANDRTVASSSSSLSSSASSSSKGLTEPLHYVYINPNIDSATYFKAPLAHYIETQGLHGYNAVDLAAPVGTPIMAAAAGKVIVSKVSGWNGGYGRYVVISHPNGTQTLYAHMSKDVSTIGGTVAQGQIIGYVGLTGKTTGPHVHFEIRGARNPF